MYEISEKLGGLELWFRDICRVESKLIFKGYTKVG